MLGSGFKTVDSWCLLLFSCLYLTSPLLVLPYRPCPWPPHGYQELRTMVSASCGMPQGAQTLESAGEPSHAAHIGRWRERTRGPSIIIYKNPIFHKVLSQVISSGSFCADPPPEACILVSSAACFVPLQSWALSEAKDLCFSQWLSSSWSAKAS